MDLCVNAYRESQNRSQIIALFYYCLGIALCKLSLSPDLMRGVKHLLIKYSAGALVHCSKITLNKINKLKTSIRNQWDFFGTASNPNAPIHTFIILFSGLNRIDLRLGGPNCLTTLFFFFNTTKVHIIYCSIN